MTEISTACEKDTRGVCLSFSSKSISLAATHIYIAWCNLYKFSRRCTSFTNERGQAAIQFFHESGMIHDDAQSSASSNRTILENVDTLNRCKNTFQNNSQSMDFFFFNFFFLSTSTSTTITTITTITFQWR